MHMVNKCMFHSAPAVIAISSVVLNASLFLYRVLFGEQKKFPTLSVISLIFIFFYIVLLGITSVLLFNEDFCHGIIGITAMLSLNWIVVLLTLYCGKITFQNIMEYQICVSGLEMTATLWFFVALLHRGQVAGGEWYYIPISVCCLLVGVLCNGLWINSLYCLRQEYFSAHQLYYSHTLLPHDEQETFEIINGSTKSRGEYHILRSVWFSWFTSVLNRGSEDDLDLDDLVPLPCSMTSAIVRQSIQPICDGSGQVIPEPKTIGYYLFQLFFTLATYECSNCSCRKQTLPPGSTQHDVRTSSVDSAGSSGLSVHSDIDGNTKHPESIASTLPPLWHSRPILYAILVEGDRGSTFAQLGFIKLLIVCVSFTGPLLLGQMVSLVEKEPTQDDIPLGVILTCTLGLSFVALAILNTQYTIRANVMQLKIRGALSLGLFSRALQLSLREHYARNLSDAQVANMLQVDVQRASDIIVNLHDLWALPCQIIIAFALLYLQVNVAFFTGIFIIIVMVPINRWIAVRIAFATDHLMRHKDARVKLVTECIRNMKSVKMCGLEHVMSNLSMAHRAEEVKFLSQRKYLDAWCVFLWAAMPLLVPYVTFVTTVTVLDKNLSAAEVFTTIALLNMLIFPMNAYPWIINGIVEASVSIRRLSLLLVVPEEPFEGRGNLGPTLGSCDDVDGDSSSDTKKRLILDLGYEFQDAYSIHNAERTDSNIKLGPRGGHAHVVSVPASIPSATRSGELSPVVPSYSLFGNASFIVARDITVSWNASELHRLERRIMSKVHSLEEARQIYKQRVLKDTTFAVGPLTLTGVRGGMVIGICGSVGSGKSTLLLGLLQECYIYSPSYISTDPGMSYIRTSVSYCSQSPAMHAGTVKSNVCFESLFVASRYLDIMHGCGLDVDFNVDTAEAMDDVDIGQGGSRLSGGQRLRVGIARALYADTSTVLLDDPFSALDWQTSSSIMKYLLSISERDKRCIVLVTNDINLLASGVDVIYVLANGQVAATGQYENLIATSEAFQSLREELVRHHSKGSYNSHTAAARNADAIPSGTTKVLLPEGSTTELLLSCESGDTVHSNDDEEVLLARQPRVITESSGCDMRSYNAVDTEGHSDITDSRSAGARHIASERNDQCQPNTLKEEDEHMERGQIDTKVITTYFRSVGYGVVGLILASTLCMQASSNGMSFWLAYWTDHLDHISDRSFLIISSTIIGANVIFALVRSFSFAWGGLIAAKKQYQMLTKATFSTYMTFFESNSLGRIINRFGRDADAMDDNLPFMLNRVLAQIFTLLGAIVIISVSSVLVIVVIAVVAILYYRLQRYYRTSSRDLRRLESIFKSPVGNILMDCLANAPSIRAQKLQLKFEEKMATAIDNSQRVSLTSCIAGQWLTVRLQALGIVVTFSLALVAVFNAVYKIVPVSASMLGLSLSYAFALVGYLNGLVNSVIETEQEMISIERIDEYIQVPSEYSSYDEDSGDEDADDKRLSIPYGSDITNDTSELLGMEYGTVSASGVATHPRIDDLWPLHGDIVLRNVSFSYEKEKMVSIQQDQNTNGALTRAKRVVMSTFARVRSISGGSSRDMYVTHSNSDDDDDGDGCARHNEMVQYALKDVSVVIPAGSRVAVIGRTGSGKSSFLRLLLNLNKCFEGYVMIGGLDIRDISKKKLRSCCGVIAQEPFLFTGTIRRNIDPKGQFDDESIIRVICQCGIINTFSEASDVGVLVNEVYTDTMNDSASARDTKTLSSAATTLLDLQIADGANSLSQGQKQLLCVARVLLGKPKFVFLDEASSSLDPASESLMYQALAVNLPPETTVLAISHRYDREGIRRLCTQVMELENGRLAKYEDIYVL